MVSTENPDIPTRPRTSRLRESVTQWRDIAYARWAENDALQAENSRLRDEIAALIRDDVQFSETTRGGLMRELQLARAESTRLRAKALAEALEAYEKWEAELVMSRDAWRGPLPSFTESLFAKWMEIQAVRNAALCAYQQEVLALA